jgi:hypothetical protein
VGRLDLYFRRNFALSSSQYRFPVMLALKPKGRELLLLSLVNLLTLGVFGFLESKYFTNRRKFVRCGYMIVLVEVLRVC